MKHEFGATQELPTQTRFRRAQRNLLMRMATPSQDTTAEYIQRGEIRQSILHNVPQHALACPEDWRIVRLPPLNISHGGCLE